jgi:hypothetical protein
MILVAQCGSPDNFTRTTVLTWIYEFIALGKTKLLPFVADMLGAALACISDQEEEIRQYVTPCSAPSLSVLWAV